MADRTSKKMDETLDFLSPKFDPLKALYAADLQPPVPNIQIFNNVAEYALAIKEGKTRSTEVVKPRGATDSSRQALSRTKNLKPEYKPVQKDDLLERLKAIAESKAGNIEGTKLEKKSDVRMDDTKLQEFILAEETFKAEQKRKKRMDVIQRMDVLSEGPFSILYTCLTERRRVRVWTRRYKGLRSVLAGYLVAFDKHMNLALFDVDEVYTLEERIEQHEVKDESQETKKNKKKKKKAISPVENKTPGGIVDSTIAEIKSSLLVPSNEVLNTPSKETNCEEGITSTQTDSRGLHTVSASEFDSQSSTEFLPSNVEPQFLHCTVLTDCNNSEGNSEGYSVCDHSMDTSGDELSMPSAKALSVALQTAILPFVHAESSPLTEDKTNDAGKYNPKQQKDTGDSNANNELVLGDSDSRTMEPESLDLIGTSTSGHSKGILDTNASVADVHLLDGEVTTQTQQCDSEKENTQGAIIGNTLLRQTDGENNDLTHAVRNSNDLDVSPCITKEQHVVISVDAHESDVAVLEHGCISVDTNNPVNTTLEHEAVEVSENVRESNVIFVDGSRLVNENNDIRHKDHQKQLRNCRKHNEENEYCAGANNDSPLIELECFEIGKNESCLNESQDNDEYVPCSKEVDERVCDTSLNGSFGTKYATDEVEKYEGSSHVKVKSEYDVDDIEPSGNLALHVFGMMQLQSERMKSVVDTETGSMNVPRSVRIDTSAMKQVPTQIETVSHLKLKTVEPLKVQNENYDRPRNDCEDAATLEIKQSVTLEGTKLAECEANETTSSFDLQGSDVSESLQQMETYPTLCANAETTCSKTIEMHFQSFSSSMELQTDSSSNSFISNIQDCRLWRNNGTHDAPMALDVAVESYSSLTGVVDIEDISQGLREHGVDGTQQASLTSTQSNHEVLSEEGERSDLTSATPENTVFVSEKLLIDPDSLSGENGAVSSDQQCSALELNSDNLLSKDEDVNLKTHLLASQEFGHYDEQVEKTMTSETDQTETQLSEAEVSCNYSDQTKDGKPDDGELINSHKSLCSSSFSHKGSGETFASLDNERDSNPLCVVVNLSQSGNDVKDVSRTMGLNFSSEHPATKSSVKSEGDDFPEKNGAEVTCDNVIAEEQANAELPVPMKNSVEESKRKGDDEKEEGEITSDEDDTYETTKHMKKEREEGELSSSNSEAEASPHEKHGEASVPRSELMQNKSVFCRKEKELHTPRRQSLSEVPHRVSEERSKVPENSRSDRKASLPYFKKTDLRSKLSEARKTRSSLKGSPTFISGETRGRRPRETPVEKRVKNSTVEKPRQGKSVRDTTKTGNKAIVKSSKLQRVSHGKRRETGQQIAGIYNETKPGSSQRRDQTTESSLKFVKETGGKCDNSLQGDGVKAKKASPITPRQKKPHDRCDTSEVNPNKTSKDSTVSRGAQGNRNIRKSRNDQRKVKGKESIINIDTSVDQKARDCKGGHRKTAKDSCVMSRSKVEPNACPQDSQKEPLRVKKEKMKISTTAKLSLNEPDKHRKVESSLRPPSDNETSAKEACILTRSKSDNKKCKGEKTNSFLLSSEGKAKDRPENSSKATGERKTMEMKNRQNDKSKSKRVKTPVKASQRITPRKVLKKLPSNVITCKTKVQARHVDREKAGNTRKRARVIDIDTTELRQAKKLRLEERNDCSSKSPVAVSTIEKLKPSAKRGEYNNRENQPPAFKLEQEVIPPEGEKFKTADDEMCMDEPKTNSYNRTLSKTLLIGGNKRLVFKQRHVNQLFIRGDNVVMVAYAK